MSQRVGVAILWIALLAAMLVALPHKLFELDRYFVPKELVLHVAALLLALTVLLRARPLIVDRADVMLALFLAWSVASALFATNHWLAQRALGVSVSGAIVFWSARRLGQVGHYRVLLSSVAAASVIAACTALLQAYGYQADLFSLNRAPGGTFGNRNFVAHICAIGLPSLIYATLNARSGAGAMAGYLGGAIIGATLVLSRSRAAWLAVATALVVVILPLIVSRKYWGSQPVPRRLMGLAVVAGLAGVAAAYLPNRLNWRSDSPYLDSAIGVVDYSTGSGRGRVAQYRNSLDLALDNPLFGTGPGNWPVHYPRFAPDNDRSLTDDGMTANPWPSSDWVAHVSERGFVAAALLLAVFTILFFTAMQRWRQLNDADAVLAKVALLGTITTTMVVSAFDAVLLLAAPSVLAWAAIGAASGVGRGGRELTLSRGAWTSVVAVALGITVISVGRSAAQVVAITKVGTGGTRAGWIAAAGWDRGSYRIHQRVAELQAARGQCAAARVHASRARGLFPDAAPPQRILRQCRR